MRTDLTKVDVRLAVATSAPFRDLPVMIECLNPKHKDDTTSMAVYRDHIHCYGCGLSIPRRMDSLAYLLKISVYDAIKRAGEFLETTPREYKKKEVKLQPLPPAVVASYESLLWGWRKDRLTWLSDRGLTEETIRLFHLGHDSTRYTIPVYDATGKLVTMRYRTDPKSVLQADPDEKQSKTRKYSGLFERNDLRLYPEWLISESEEDFLVVCEGELDAVRVWQEGIPAGTPINGAGNLRNIIPLLGRFPRIKRLYIASDMDDAGEKGARELIEEATAAGYEAIRLTWPRAMGKDVTELLEWQGTDFDYELFKPIIERARRHSAA